MSLNKSELQRGLSRITVKCVRRAKAAFPGVFHPATALAGSDRIGHGGTAGRKGWQQIGSPRHIYTLPKVALFIDSTQSIILHSRVLFFTCNAGM
jgi:hypothetical protein